MIYRGLFSRRKSPLSVLIILFVFTNVVALMMLYTSTDHEYAFIKNPFEEVFVYKEVKATVSEFNTEKHIEHKRDKNGHITDKTHTYYTYSAVADYQADDGNYYSVKILDVDKTNVKGARITIYYDPENPERAINVRTRGYDIIFIVVCAILDTILITALILYIRKKKKEKRKAEQVNMERL